MARAVRAAGDAQDARPLGSTRTARARGYFRPRSRRSAFSWQATQRVAAGYDMRARKLVIELTSGTYEYQSVPSEVWRRFSDASSPWSYYRDNIEEEYTAKRLR